MRLTRYTDYAMRVLLYLGARPDRLCAISEISGAYRISQNHLMKIVHDLGKAGYISSVRGRMGGIRLARPPAEISVGAVVRHAEEGFELIDCTNCAIQPACGLNSVVHEALAAFLAVFDHYTLEDLLGRRSELLTLLNVDTPADGGGKAIAENPSAAW